MSQLVRSIIEKKNFLIEFYQLNANELHRFENGNFGEIDAFYYKRERVLDILKLIEKKIQFLSLSKHKDLFLEENKNKVQSLNSEIEEMTQKIIDQDLQIIKFIGRSKENLIKELHGLMKNKSSVSSYKTKNDHHQIDEQV